MLIGMYDNILMLFSNVLDLSFVIDNIMLYISYGIGMMISFIVFSIGINYLLKKLIIYDILENNHHLLLYLHLTIERK